MLTAALVLQNRWVLYKAQKNKKLTTDDLDMINGVMLLDDAEFDYAQEIYDLSDDNLRKSRSYSVSASNNIRGQSMSDVEKSGSKKYLSDSAKARSSTSAKHTNSSKVRNKENTNNNVSFDTNCLPSSSPDRPSSSLLRTEQRESTTGGGYSYSSKTTEKEKKRRLASKLVNLLDTPWAPPDWVSARRSTDFMNPRKGGKGGVPFETLTTTTGRHCFSGGCGEQCDLFGEGRVSEFSIYGPGVTNYFKFIKWLAWVMFAVSLVSLPMLIINITSGSTVATSSTSSGLNDLAKTTIGNLETTFSNTNSTNFEIYLPFCDPSVWGYSACGLNKEKIGYLYMGLDIMMTTIVMIGFLWLVYFESNEEKTLNKNTVYTSMFTIAVKNLPKDTTESEIKSHFELALKRNFRIHAVDFAYDNELVSKLCTYNIFNICFISDA